MKSIALIIRLTAAAAALAIGGAAMASDQNDTSWPLELSGTWVVDPANPTVGSEIEIILSSEPDSPHLLCMTGAEHRGMVVYAGRYRLDDNHLIQLPSGSRVNPYRQPHLASRR